MRTVTFSDAKVAQTLNAGFVAAWHNRAPGFHNDDYTAEKRIFQRTNEAYLTGNICTFVLSPDGRVFHYVAGYLAPELFVDFLKTALAMYQTLREGGLHELRKLHAARAKMTELKPDVAERTYRGERHTHTDACRRTLTEARRYFIRLHKRWSEVKELPALEDVRYRYLYGDPFTEESSDASKIARDPMAG